MANLLFKKGSYNEFKNKVLNGTATDGTLYFTEDEGALYIGTFAGKAQRIRGTVQYYENLNQFTQNVAPPYSTDVIYFIAESDALVRWNGTKWIHLNTSAATAALLEEKINTNTTNIENLNGALTAKADELNGKISANTTAIGTNTANITQLQADVATKAAQSDLAALTTRVTTAEGDIDNLEGVVATKAAQSDLTALTTRVTTAEGEIDDLQTEIAKKATKTELTTVSNKVDDNAEAIEGLDGRLGNAEGVISNHTTEINGIKTTLSSKANSSDLQALATRVTNNEDNIEDLFEAVDTKASQEDLNNAVDRIGNAEEVIGNHTTSIQTINTELAKKATNAALTALTTRVTTAEGEIDDLQTDVAKKANQSDLNTLSGRVDNAETLLSQKANQSDLNTLSGTVSANKTAADTGIQEAKTAASNAQKKADANETAIGTINENIETINEALATKAAASDLAALQQTVNNNETDIEKKFSDLSATVSSNETDIEDKVSKLTGRVAENEEDIGTINEALATKATKTELNDLRTELSGDINDHILAANAMEYQGVVKSATELSNIKSAKIGYTYVVASESNGGFGNYTNGDLLIASGTEDETTGLITGSITWQHVKTGYMEAHNPTLSLDGNVIQLNSFSDALLGAVSLNSANSSLTISGSGSALTFNMVWGSF